MLGACLALRGRVGNLPRLTDEPPGARRPVWSRVVASWVIATLVAAGLVGVALRSARGPGTGLLDRLAPDTPGTTWLYREVTNGAPTGTATVRVASTGTSAQAQGPLEEAHFDNYAGRGPRDQISFRAKLGNRLVLLGVRQAGVYSQFTPPQTLLELPVQTGHSFTWRGKRQSPPADLTVVTSVVGIDTLTIAGQRRSGCPHLHDETTVTATGKPDFLQSGDRWMCPGLGDVRSSNLAPSLGLRLDEELLSVHGPGIDAGPPTPVSPAPAGPAAPGVSAAPGPPPSIDTSRVAWSDTRVNLVQFPPVGRQGLVVVEEEGGRVAAFDPAVGRVRWAVQIAVPAAAGPVVGGEAVLVPDAAKHLLALDPTSGATRWAAGFADVVSADPLVLGDRAIVATEDGRLHALALADGRSRWDSVLAAPPSGLAGLGSDVVVATSDGTVSSRSAATGALRWSSHLQGKTTAGPVSGSGTVVATDDQGQLSAFDAATGNILWTDLLRRNVSLLTLAGSTVLVPDGSVVRAFDLRTGHKRWTADAGAPVATPVVVGDDVFVATRDNLLRVAVADGKRRGVLALPRPGPGLRPRSALAPVMIAGQLLVTLILDPDANWPRTTILAYPDRQDTGPDGVFFTGELRRVPTPPSRAPVRRGNDLLFVTRDGTVYDAPATGSPRPVLTAKAIGGFLVSAGSVLLTRDGDSLAATGPTGRLWTYPLGSPSLADVPAADAGSVFVPVKGKGLAALSPDTGRLQWFFPTAGLGETTPLVLPGGDVVFASGDLARLDGPTGHVRWRIAGFDAIGPLARANGVIFASGFFHDAPTLLAVEEETGAVRWAKSVSVNLLSAPAATATEVAVVGADGLVQVFDAASGQPRWELPLTSPASPSPVIVGGRLAVSEEGRIEDFGQLDHRVTVYDPGTGRFLGVFEPGGDSFGIDSFTAAGGRLLFPTLARGFTGVYVLGLGGVAGP